MRSWINLLNESPNEDKIHQWLRENSNLSSTNIFINDNGTVDIETPNQAILKKPIPTELFTINKCSGDLEIHQTNEQGLYGCPNHVDGYFILVVTSNFKSLEGGPEIVEADYTITNNDNALKSLKGIAKKIGSKLVIDDPESISPWEMRYVLFSDISTNRKLYPNPVEFYDFNDAMFNEIEQMFTEYFNLNKQERENKITEYMMKLKNFT